jgi:hypothetical protein
MIDEGCNIMQIALISKREDTNKFVISHFGPALMGMAFWNNNKTTKPVLSELLTITDMMLSFTCALSTIAQPGRCKKTRNQEKQIYKSW